MDFVRIKLVNTQRQNDAISIVRLGFPNCGKGSKGLMDKMPIYPFYLLPRQLGILEVQGLLNA